MDNLEWIVLYYSCFTVLWISIQATDDPCSNHSTFDVSSIGSRNEECSRPALQTERLCDYRLRPAWYYIPYDGHLLNKCPTAGTCGTDSPVWINGTLPSDADGVVDRACCIKEESDCCRKQFTLQVKKCSDKFVYYLPSLEACDSVYCINTDLPCQQTTSTSTTTPTTTSAKHYTANGSREATDDPCFKHSTFDVRSLGSRNDECSRPYLPAKRLCDYRLKSAWYFIPYDGHLLNTCPTAGTCGTDFPVWINGTLPLDADGVVNRTCCIKENSDCCRRQLTVQVKKCSDKYVYYLPSLEACDSVYCIKTNLPCQQTTTTTTTTTSTSSAKDYVVDGDTFNTSSQRELLIGLCIGTVIILCSVAGVLLYLVYINHGCKKNSRIDDSEKSVYENYVVQVPSTASPLYSELYHGNY